eukprot:10871915-Alexandrium_andersonii.AAC.1
MRVAPGCESTCVSLGFALRFDALGLSFGVAWGCVESARVSGGSSPGGGPNHDGKPVGSSLGGGDDFGGGGFALASLAICTNDRGIWAQ